MESISMNRRQMLGMMGIMAGSGTAMTLPALGQASVKSGPRLLYFIKDYGALGDGTTLDNSAINRAIDACHAAGGGMVYVPPGVYLCGTVVLKSNVTLYLEAGATLLGSKNLADYPLQSGPLQTGGTTMRHLVFARDADNVGLAGPGLIDGQGHAFWAPSGRAIPPDEQWRYAIAFEWKALDRPSPMVEFYNCNNVHIQDVRIENSPGWTLRPIQCDNVFIRGISIKNPVYGPNTDGIDPTCCRNVFISDCMIDTGDDAICLKSENPYGDAVQASKNITVTNCVLTGCCNGFKMGTATRGSFENVVFSNSVIFNEDVPLSERIISGIAVEMVDGGSVEGVLISNIRMQRVRTPIFIRRANRAPRPDGTPGTLRGVMIENVYATGSILTSSITGLPGFDVQDVTLSNIRIDSDEAGQADWVSRQIPEVPKGYPEAHAFGRLPGYGFYCRHVTGMRIRNVEFKAATAEERPAIFCDDVKDLDIGGFTSSPIVGTQPAIQLVQTAQALLRDCNAPAGTKAFLGVQGDKTDGIVLMSSNLSSAEQAVQAGAEVSNGAVKVLGNLDKA
jgi:Glycosyl hydrolases family 28